MNIPANVREALRSPVDYSPQFTESVNKIANLISERLEINVCHDSDMNYRASQSLSFKFSDKAPFAPAKGESIEVRIYISSRAKLFCFYCFDHKGKFYKDGPGKHPARESLFPIEIRTVLSSCRQLLRDSGYEEVGSELFNVLAVGCFTELDDHPATVFQVLFTEIV